MAAYLRAFGYTIADMHVKSGGPSLSLSVPEHKEVDGHTVYQVQCLLVVDGAEPIKWQVGRRLRHLRSLWHDRVKVALGDEYAQLFAGYHFASRGGCRGTSKSLSAWCQKLAACSNMGKLTPAALALTLRFLEAPRHKSEKQASISDILAPVAAAQMPAPVVPKTACPAAFVSGTVVESAEEYLGQRAMESVATASDACRCSAIGSGDEFASGESTQCSSDLDQGFPAHIDSDKESEGESDCDSTYSDSSDGLCDRIEDWASDFMTDNESSDED